MELHCTTARTVLYVRSLTQHRSVKLATRSQLLVAGYLFCEKLATISQ